MAGVQSHDQDIDIDVRALFASLGAHWLRILVVTLSVAAVAFMLATMATRHYKAETRIVIETRESVFTRPQETAGAASPVLDDQGVTSQVQIITSSDLLKTVAAELDLAGRAEFNAADDTSLVSRLLGVAGLKDGNADVPEEERVLQAFREQLTVYKVEGSRVIVIEFSSENPELAALVPNAVADAYLAMQQGAKLQSNADATEWLQPEIAELRAQVSDAEAKVADFRASSDLLIGNNNSALATQQLSELSSELSRVRANRAATEADSRAVRDALAAGAPIDSLPEVLSNGLVQRLRESQVQLKAEIADLSATLLGNHPRIRALRSQLADLDRQISAEAEKVLKGLETEARAAALRETELVAELDRLKVESNRVAQEEVGLRALEREAAAQRQLLETYLARYREAVSRQDRSYLPVDARIFSRATVPAEPYFPKPVPIAGAAFAGSLLLMAVATLLAELFSGRAMRPAPRPSAAPAVAQIVMPLPAQNGAGRASSGAYSAGAGNHDGPGRLSVSAAARRLAEKGSPRAVFVSPEGDEAAAVSAMVAREAADAGLRVLLLDLTTSGAASSAMLDGAAPKGITDLLCAEASFGEIIHADLYSHCHVIPAGRGDAAEAMRAIDRLPIVLQSLTTAYDLVVIECGEVDAARLRRVVGDGAEVMLSAIDDLDETVVAAARTLVAEGFGRAALVLPGANANPAPHDTARSRSAPLA
ncbi:GumC family protein [Mesorhizobium xinjiangense]|uniref:GumC family protein n=1 Tax=Mesorhizobium xinjiangense TaxID=2678685 RepID=UPI0012EDA235|nr:Wzz/FepE/Etk N-terminal domain-containing protein [Mesorhizobium xinjiangense]